MLEITQIPALTDNYIYLLRDQESGETAVVDPSEATPVLTALKGEKLNYILNTHHHWDHTGGNLQLQKATGAMVVGFEGDAHRIPGIDRPLKDGQSFSLGQSTAKILFIPGHTLGHIAYHFARDLAVFCGDTLFSLGCGRLFEGTPAQMFHSLARLKNLADDTRVYCGHEYTVANAKFALTIDPKNDALRKRQKEAETLRAQKLPTVPSLLIDEKACNPFLRAATEAEFARLRKLKDDF
jgi:hydroxyacylglutathione hydrolase